MKMTPLVLTWIDVPAHIKNDEFQHSSNFGHLYITNFGNSFHRKLHSQWSNITPGFLSVGLIPTAVQQ